MTDQDNNSYIIFEHDKEYNGISFYDNKYLCCGDVPIDSNIYEVKNPFFLSDTFIFSKKHYDNVFMVGECDIICYIKINSYNQIEEIGTDFCRRFHSFNYDSILQRTDVKEASQINKIIFSIMGDEYWLKKHKEAEK